MSKVEFPKPTESAKELDEYLKWLNADTSKELAQSIFIELLKESKEVIMSPLRFNGVDIRVIKQVFERHGIIEVDKTTNL